MFQQYLCLQVDVTERALKTELEATKLNLHNEIMAKASKAELVSELLDLDNRINSTNENLVNQKEQLATLKVVHNLTSRPNLDPFKLVWTGPK